MGLGKIFTKKCAQLHVLFAVETNLGFWWDLEKFSQKSVPSHKFLRCADYLKFLMGIGIIFTKKCAQSHVSSLWRLTWVFDATWKVSTKKVWPVTRFFAVETNLSFWWDLEKFSQKSLPSRTFLRCGDYLKFLRGLGKFRQKKVPSYTFCSLWSLTWVFDGTWKSFHKKSVPSHRFLRCADYLKFLMGLGKIFTKKCAQSHVSSLWRLTWVFIATWKVSTKKVWPVTRFFAVETNLGFWWDLGKFSQKKCAQSQVSSLCRLSQVFDGHRNNFHKKVCPVTRLFAVETNLSFWCDLESFDKKSVTSYTFFCCGD